MAVTRCGDLHVLDGRATAGMLRLLEEKEEKLGITPDARVSELMSGMHHDEDPSCNVALTLQVRSAAYALPHVDSAAAPQSWPV
jgi:hypothetical protein